MNIAFKQDECWIFAYKTDGKYLIDVGCTPVFREKDRKEMLSYLGKSYVSMKVPLDAVVCQVKSGRVVE